ncbi:hypothetical protein C0J52_25046 [Blattella germanica]|nr:hypothetical protein C0J52_25046 [Blattella germanica]
MDPCARCDNSLCQTDQVLEQGSSGLNTSIVPDCCLCQHRDSSSSSLISYFCQSVCPLSRARRAASLTGESKRCSTASGSDSRSLNSPAPQDGFGQTGNKELERVAKDRGRWKRAIEEINESVVAQEPIAGPSRAITNENTLVTPVLCRTPQKSPRKRSFRSVVPIPQVETSPKKVRATQKAVVLTTPQYQETIRSKSSQQPRIRVQLFQAGNNLKKGDSNSGKQEDSKAAKEPSVVVSERRGPTFACQFCDVPSERHSTQMKLLCLFLTIAFSVSLVYAQDCTIQEQDVTQEGLIEYKPYPANGPCIYYTWKVSVDGANVDITVENLDLDANSGDYLIISPGSSLKDDNENTIMTGKITSRKFRILRSSEMFLMLVIQGRTQASDDFQGIKLTYKPYGIKPKDLVTKRDEFKQKMATMADAYCASKNITLLEATPIDNVVLDFITSCPSTWPDWETCTKIEVVLPVFVEESSSYELTRTHIEEMWSVQRTELESMGLQPYEEPNAEETMLIWVYVALGVVAVFTLILLAAWKTDVFSSNKKTSQFDPIGRLRISETSEDSWISITNSYQTYQEVPPIFYDETIEKRPTIETAPNTLSIPEIEKPRQSEEFKAAVLFGTKRGFDNPSFDIISEEIPNERKNDHIDDFSSDEEMPSKTDSTM